MILQEKNKINLNFELALNNSVIMLPTKINVDRPKTKSAIALTKNIHTSARLSPKRKPTANRLKIVLTPIIQYMSGDYSNI